VFATDRGYEKVIFETDCVVLLNHWESHVCDISVIKLILDEIAKLVNLFSFVPFVLLVARLTKRLTVAQKCINTAGEFCLLGMWSHQRLGHNLETDCIPMFF
jgi:hypothetical protein